MVSFWKGEDKQYQIVGSLYFGDTEEILRQGAGQFMGSVYPGEMGTSLIGGHNVDDFGKLGAVPIGDTIEVQTSYGNYTYRVTQLEVKNKKIRQLIE